jgi:hypothetical protein
MTDLSEARAFNQYSHFPYLIALRDQLGRCFGSQETCVWMYNMVKREKPSVVVELGTGLGVTAAWIGAALKENGHGRLYTFDNESAFPEIRKIYLDSGLAEELAPLGQSDSLGALVGTMCDALGTSDYVSYAKTEFNLPDTSWLREVIGAQGASGVMPRIDIMFSDFNHRADTTAKVVGTFLPLMAETASILIDSASTHMPSYYLLEQLVQMFNAGRVPKELRDLHVAPEDKVRLEQIIRQSRFQLVHLVERVVSRQNSTAWLRIEQNSLLPALALCVH